MDESRKQFERFLREEHLYSDDELFWESDRNCYSIYPVHIAWKAWQASRENIEIWLPRRKAAYASGYGDGYLVDSLMGDALEYDETVDAIRAAGIKVKE